MSNDCEYVIQGVAADFERPYLFGDDCWLLKAGSFDKSLAALETELWIDHDSNKRLGSMRDRLQIHAGKSLAFRYFIEATSGDELTDVADTADDLESYFGISVNHTPTKTEKVTIEGVDVTLVHESRLVEISMLSTEPAVKSTYGYFASCDSCNDLAHDVETGLFAMRGKAISLHRKISASENGGVIKYNNRTSAMDIAANKFTRLLSRLS
jgi:phage head maturation protease